MAGRKSTRASALMILLTLAGCSDYADYPKLLPMDQLTAEPNLPADAAIAARSPDAVDAELAGKRGELQARAQAAKAHGPDTGDLAARAEALRKRAQELSQTSMDQGTCPEGQTCPETSTPKD